LKINRSGSFFSIHVGTFHQNTLMGGDGEIADRRCSNEWNVKKIAKNKKKKTKYVERTEVQTKAS